jgi:outer membrane protein assembly factor BamB
LTSDFCDDTMQSSPVVAGGVVYIGSADGNLYALE